MRMCGVSGLWVAGRGPLLTNFIAQPATHNLQPTAISLNPLPLRISIYNSSIIGRKMLELK
jgi:hypothetical protein